MTEETKTALAQHVIDATLEITAALSKSSPNTAEVFLVAEKAKEKTADIIAKGQRKDNMSEELRACPSCGSTAIKIERAVTIGNVVAHTIKIYCSGTGCNMSCEAPPNRVVDMWNKRHESVSKEGIG